MKYQVIRKEIATGKVFTTTCTQEQVDNITKFPMSLYIVESINPIAEAIKIVEVTPTKIIKERTATVNTVKELNKIIKSGKREIKEEIEKESPKNMIYNIILWIKEDCKKYSDSNKTTKQIYFNFIGYLMNVESKLFPELN